MHDAGLRRACASSVIRSSRTSPQRSPASSLRLMPVNSPSRTSPPNAPQRRGAVPQGDDLRVRQRLALALVLKALGARSARAAKPGHDVERREAARHRPFEHERACLRRSAAAPGNPASSSASIRPTRSARVNASISRAARGARPRRNVDMIVGGVDQLAASDRAFVFVERLQTESDVRDCARRAIRRRGLA